MKIAEKLAREDGRQIWLYKQGAFWTACEDSALMLLAYRKLKLQKRWIKSVGREVWSVGFPEALLPHFEGILGAMKEVEPNVGCFEASATGLPDVAELRQQYSEEAHIPRLDKMWQPQQEVMGRLRDFRLAENTPMQAMILVQELQEIIFSENGDTNGNLR